MPLFRRGYFIRHDGNCRCGTCNPDCIEGLPDEGLIECPQCHRRWPHDDYALYETGLCQNCLEKQQSNS